MEGPGAITLVLAGDIGGTKSHLALYRVDGGGLAPLRDHTYATREFKRLEEVVVRFVANAGAVEAACFGVAGPVIAGRSDLVNVPWEMEESALSRSLGVPRIKLLNDLEATAYGALGLPETEVAVLQRGAPPSGERATIAVIAAGTGLGEAVLVAVGERYHAIASEGGHCDFAPRGAEQIALLEFLAGEFGHVSFERVLSGPGLVNIYRFLKERMPVKEPAWLTERFAGATDPAAVISQAALEDKEPRSLRALELFTAIYGSEAANLALKTLALGGVYVCGGIAPKILPVLKEGWFMRAFVDKGRLGAVLGGIEVRVSLNPSTGLLGAAHYAAQMVRGEV